MTFVHTPICPSPKAGLVSPECPEQLLIALEPEAASIYCRKLRLHQVIDLSLQPITNGLDPDGARPFDSGFRQGIEGRGVERRGESDIPKLSDGCFVSWKLLWGRQAFVVSLQTVCVCVKGNTERVRI